MNYSAVLDLSGADVLFAVAGSDGTPVIELAEPMRGRDSARLATVLRDALAAQGLDFGSIGRWTVGSGPGAFSGLRIASALVLGLISGGGAVARCVPSVYGLLAALPELPEGRIGVLYDGRNKECMLLEVEKRAEGFTVCSEPRIFDRVQAAEFFAAHASGYAALAGHVCERGTLLPLLPEGLDICWAERLDVRELLKDGCGPFDGDLTKLIYIRPSVTPKK